MPKPTLPSISLCMIVKNEEAYIQNCLESVRPIVSEIVVIDTGSTDRTVDIAHAAGAQIYTFKWCDDFAAARNFSLTMASGDWILVLDADEMIAPSDLAQFEKLTANPLICTEFLQRHYSDDCRMSGFSVCAKEFPDLEKNYLGYFESNCCRLFPNNEGLEFRGRIHELVEQSIFEQKRFQIRRTNARIHHYGHTPEAKKSKNKSSIYRPLGEEKAREKQDDWKSFYELGVEYNQTRQYQEAVHAFLKSIELKNDYLDTWVNIGYSFMELQLYAEAEKALMHAIVRSPVCGEAYCNLGVVYMRQRKYKEAEVILSQACAIKPDYINALCNLAETYACQNRLSESAFFYRKALASSPGMARALADLGGLFLAVGNLKEASNYLNQAMQRDPGNENAKHYWEALQNRSQG